MSKEIIKKIIKDEFEQKAPTNFTENLMDKLTTSQASYQSIIPKPILWIVGILFVSILTFTLITMPTPSFKIQLPNLSQYIQDLALVSILPFSILTLLFIKEVLLNRHKLKL